MLAQNAVQARIVLSYATGIIRSVPMLSDLVRAETADSITLASGVVLEVRPSSFRGLRGVTCLACVCDEAAFWYDDSGGSLNPDSEILAAVRPGLATTAGPLVVISSPYARRGEVFETWKPSLWREGRSAHFGCAGPDPRSNPSLSQA